jgi:hypothetical protein
MTRDQQSTPRQADILPPLAVSTLPMIFPSSFRSLIPLAASLLLLSGCQSLPRPQSETSPSARFAEYETFAVLPPGLPPDRVDKGDYVRLGGALRLHLEQQLQARGLELASPEVADVVFELVGRVTTEVSYLPGSSLADYRWGWSTRYPLYGYYVRPTWIETSDRGVLSVIASDRKARAVVWAAWMEGHYAPGAKVETVTAALDALLAQLPAR